jgi:hypothetical protein
MKMRKNWNEVPFNSKVQRFEEQKVKDYEKYLGPGCYEKPGDFDDQNVDAKPNLISSKV